MSLVIAHILITGIIALGGAMSAGIVEAGGVLKDVKGGTWVIAFIAGVVATGESFLVLRPLPLREVGEAPDALSYYELQTVGLSDFTYLVFAIAVLGTAIFIIDIVRKRRAGD